MGFLVVFYTFLSVKFLTTFSSKNMHKRVLHKKNTQNQGFFEKLYTFCTEFCTTPPSFTLVNRSFSTKLFLRFLSVDKAFCRKVICINNINRTTIFLSKKVKSGDKMLQGVNHQVVEVTRPECEYFERVIFFVKPEYSAVSEGTLRERAGKIAGEAGAPPPTKTKINRLASIGRLFLAAAAGATVTAVVSYLFF